MLPVDMVRWWRTRASGRRSASLRYAGASALLLCGVACSPRSRAADGPPTTLELAPAALREPRPDLPTAAAGPLNERVVIHADGMNNLRLGMTRAEVAALGLRSRIDSMGLPEREFRGVFEVNYDAAGKVSAIQYRLGAEGTVVRIGDAEVYAGPGAKNTLETALRVMHPARSPACGNASAACKKTPGARCGAECSTVVREQQRCPSMANLDTGVAAPCETVTVITVKRGG